MCKNVADVRFGHANRLVPSLVTEKAKVLGQVMMLKGANSKQVINDVKVRIAEIKKPRRVYINGFLELVN
jgi:cobalt-zinc-cadmium resistance protein CzcA